MQQDKGLRVNHHATIKGQIIPGLSICAGLGCSDARPTGDQKVAGSTPLGQHHSFVEIEHEIFSTVILSLPLIKEGQLSVSGKRMCTILVNCFGD